MVEKSRQEELRMGFEEVGLSHFRWGSNHASLVLRGRHTHGRSA